MKKYKLHSLLIVSSLLLSPLVSGDDNYSSTLDNKSKQKANDGYYLIQDKTWSEEGCILDKGKQRINPGDSNVLTIKKGCTWGGIRYKVFSVSNDKYMGFLAHSFREGNFSLEITAPCNGSECIFYDLNPEQDRVKR